MTSRVAGASLFGPETTQVMSFSNAVIWITGASSGIGEAIALELSRTASVKLVLSARRATYDLMNRLIAEHGDKPQAWVPHFERMAPHVVDKPTLDHAAGHASASLGIAA